jgi:hypothetical protein
MASRTNSRIATPELLVIASTQAVMEKVERDVIDMKQLQNGWHGNYEVGAKSMGQIEFRA